MKQVVAEMHSLPSLGGSVGCTLRLVDGEVGQCRSPRKSSGTQVSWGANPVGSLCLRFGL